MQILSDDNLVRGTLVGVDGNAYSLMGHFSNLAKRQGIKKSDIDKIISKAQSGDYNNLISVLDANMIDEEDDE